ncbi:glucose-6-phosphate dehydrogenase (coenzyme-F420) [Nocardioides ganghwensis]|uniref:Glucose-6-phosphate dehydrogenase (Coenzyme-F420) n=1 Tax=Nocardioides ganghwensis TaxID=252230 RepID=A0A4Q2SF95_9ACTN|nr:glucose-6-phosphate dehydrogenase (coenzyme-F420) [Nocardioides ganghwensis]MBD3945438.1 glucose-6-phosphate dehydrogenase (coenzyme-F420) [Nocardioides ganghwensis]RYC02331.1 glucose-6-phosphate dehydrogenase (coenzyme-F420) [Nocardioides ganghwensis]
MNQTSPLAVGYKASAEQFGPRELVELGVRAEKVGLDSVWISDHLQPWRHEGGHAPNALAAMAAIGERTERVVLGTSVLTPTFRYNPAVLAQQFATLALLNPGRVVLGVGTGEALNEISVGLAEWPEFKERWARLRESVRLMRELWAGERVTFDGDYYRTVDATIYDRPEGGVPIWVAAGGPQMAKYAGRVGDGFICTSGKGMDLYTDKLLPAVEEGLAASDSRRDFTRMIEIKLSYAPTREEALENCRFWAPLSLSAEQKHQLDDPMEMAAAADALPIEQVASRWIVATTPDEVVDAVRPYVEAGFDHLVFHGPGHDQEQFLTSFADEVLPGVRGLVSGG